MKRTAETKQASTLQCAIYTRKSTDEGLGQEYNSLDAQRDSGEAYIASQKHEGWACLPTRYDDGGFTGGNLERPALQRLLADIEDGKIDCIVVYKVDRLSRSLIDFAKIMDVLERNGVSFVSVTQQFNTSTSMGRLMLNVLLSFAQFERELISERTRDKIAAARRKGKWVGGRPILGYDIASNGGGGRVIVNEDEAVGQDDEVLARTLAQARAQSQDGLEALQAERRRLERELSRQGAEVRKLIDQAGTPGESPTAARLADLQERIRAAEQRATEVREQIIALDGKSVDEAELARALAMFDPVWDSLSPGEQARALQLLIERVTYDGRDGTLAITFRPTGIKALADELEGVAC